MAVIFRQGWWYGVGTSKKYHQFDKSGKTRCGLKVTDPDALLFKNGPSPKESCSKCR